MPKNTIIPLVGIVVTGALVLVMNLVFRAWQAPMLAGSQVQESRPRANILLNAVQGILPATDDQVTAAPTGTPTAFPDVTITATSSHTPTAPQIVDETAPLSATSSPTPTPAILEPCTGTLSIDYSPVWSEPRYDSVQLGLIKPGEVYPVYDYVNTGNETQWNTRFLQIDYQGVLGWTAYVYIRLSGDCSALPIPVVPTTAPPTAPSPLRGEVWTLVETHVWSDACSSAGTAEISVPVTLAFDENNTPISLSWYSRVWKLLGPEITGVMAYYGTVVVELTATKSTVDDINLVFTSPQTFEGDHTITATTGELICTAYYTLRGSRKE